MADSSIKAGIQFESYKLDRIDFSVTPQLAVLASTNQHDCGVDFSFAFRDVFKYKKQESVLYVTGLQVTLKVYDNETKNELAKGVFSITGLFSSAKTLEQETEKKLVKCQAPAILFPYIRASITHILTDAGFSTITMPLVNVNAMANNCEINIIQQP